MQCTRFDVDIAGLAAIEVPIAARQCLRQIQQRAVLHTLSEYVEAKAGILRLYLAHHTGPDWVARDACGCECTILDLHMHPRQYGYESEHELCLFF